MYRSALLKRTFPTRSLEDHASTLIWKWCEEQVRSTRSGQPCGYIDTNSFMDYKLKEQIGALYTTKAWTFITDEVLLNAVPDLQTRDGREKHLLSLCNFLNSIVKKVHINHLVGLAQDRVEEQELEDIKAEEEARGPFAFLKLPYDIRVRVYDFIVAEKYSAGGYGMGYEAFIEAPWNDDPFSDEMHERLVFDLPQASSQLRLEFLPRWHRAVGLRFEMDPWHSVQEIGRWLEVFGASRIPLTRRFEFQFGWDTVRLELRGAHLRKMSGRGRQITDIRAALKDKIKIISPEVASSYRKRARVGRELDFEFDLERFVKPLLVERGDQSVQLTVAGVNRIMEYLRQRAIPDEDSDSDWEY